MSIYCQCRKFTLDNAIKKPAPQDWQASQVWVCTNCNKIHHAVQEVPRMVRGPVNAHALLHAKGRADGTNILTWAVGEDRHQVDTIEYITYPRTIGMTDKEPRLFRLWELLQSKVEVIVDNEPTQRSPDLEYQGWMAAKAQARGIAEALAILMHPFVENADEVVRHAVKFHKDKSYEVPGLGLHLWDPLVNPDGTPRMPITSPKRTPRATTKAAPKPTAPSRNSLKPDEIEGIKNALDSGMFSKEDLASMYKVSLATLESVLT